MAKYRIMVVDDEADVRQVIAATLRAHYEVVEAHDGLDALEKMDRVEPDFVLMDVMMPLMDGYQACESIRKNPRFRTLPVMFLSALGTKEDIRRGYSAGANLYLTKPFDPARLLRNIQLFFETNPPREARKRYTVEQLAEMERSSELPKRDIHEAETQHDFFIQPQPSGGAAPSSPLAAGVSPAPAPPAHAPSVPPAPPAAGRGAPSHAPSAPPLAPPAPVRPQSIPAAMPPSPDVYELAPEPAAEEAPPVEYTAHAAASVPTAALKPRVMIVDDDEEVINLMTMILGDLYEVTFAMDGLQAIERIVRHQPDLIVVDIMLPKMSGFQLCQSLRANKSFAKTPILICSAKSGERDIAYAKRVGANEYLTKPFESIQLLDRIDALKRAPGFMVRPKTMSILEVLQEIRPSAPQTDAFVGDAAAREADEDDAAGKSEDVIKNFLKKEGRREAFLTEEEKKKKKGGFFGFGRKKS